MNEDSTPLQALERIKSHYKDKVCIDVLDDFDIIETALKEKEQQDGALKTLKEVIAFAKKLPDIKFDDDGNIQGIFGAVGIKIQRQMENQERELFRKWVLETCFPKELKALKIIDDCDVDVWLLKHCDYSNYCRVRKLCLESTGNADVDDSGKEVINLPTEEEFDFLKEILK